MEIEHNYQYDLFVIGGGSGGISTARNASKLGKKVALCDFVKPSPQGTKWGVGGTCVNVGCIPKKMMHFAALSGELLHDQKAAGWDVDVSAKHSWEIMRKTVNDYIQILNSSYKRVFVRENIKYYNALASFIDNHTVKLVKKNGTESTVTADKILIAVGGRPRYLDIPGCKELCISSDDIFWRKQEPGKTLVIGAGYIALECGGFIAGLKHEVAIMVRSVPLRKFDQEIVGKIVHKMEELGVRFLNKCTPNSFEKLENGKILAKWTWTQEDDTKVEKQEEFDTVLVAIGRKPDLSRLNLEAVGVKLSDRGSIIVDKNKMTSAEGIYAVGDIIVGSPELTPVAVAEGRFLASRLFDGGTDHVNYDLISTTIFTPIEYACIGPSEEKAKELYGEENIDVYYTQYKPLEWKFLKTDSDTSLYFKLIVKRETDEPVIAMHIFSPNAGEIIQGFAVAITQGITKAQLDKTTKIHPIKAEDMIGLRRTKRESKKTA